MKKYRIYAEITGLIALLGITYQSTIIWMAERFTRTDSYYSHGFLVPVVTAYLIWLKKEELAGIKRMPSLWGLVLIVFGLLLHVASTLAEVFFVSGFSIFFVVCGLSLFLYGKEITRKISFPLLFLLFMFPLPLVTINDISFQLKMFVTNIAVQTLEKFTSIPLKREGFHIYFPNASLTVGNPCSGLRSLIAMLALGSVFAYLLRAKIWKKAILFVLAVPIALFSNYLRVIVLCFAAFIYGNKAIQGFFHDMTGYLVFVIAFVLLWASFRFLETRKGN